MFFLYIYLINLYEIVYFHHVLRFCVDLGKMVNIMQKYANWSKNDQMPKTMQPMQQRAAMSGQMQPHAVGHAQK